MAAEVRTPPEPDDQVGQIPTDNERLKQEWQLPVISKQLKVSSRILQLVESDSSPNRKQVSDVSRTSSPGKRQTEQPAGHPLSAGKEPRLKAYCFGNFELEVDGRRIDKWHSLKAKSLLKFLIARRNKPVSRDVLMELLWPDCNLEDGKNNLKAVVYFLRHTMPGDKANRRVSRLILVSEGQYFIDPQVELWVDVDEFEQHWLRGRNLEKQGKKEEAIREFCMAEELYQGDYLEEDRYADWTLLQREALRDTYLAILAKLASNSFNVADYESCILYSQKILLKDTCHEEAYRWIMRCYSRLGNPRRARQWYKVCADTMKKELDTAPDVKTTDLYRRLLTQESI